MKVSGRPPWALLLFVACLFGFTGRGSAASTHRAVFLDAIPEDAREHDSESDHRELLFKTINFVILVGVLGFLLRKPLAGFFVDRSASIRKSLDEGRKALEISQAQLRAVKEKLARLGDEIQAFQEAGAREMKAERERMRQATARDAEAILESAAARVDAATRAGILELKAYAAGEALKQAEELIRQRLDPASRGRLVARFVEGLTVDSSVDG